MKKIFILAAFLPLYSGPVQSILYKNCAKNVIPEDQEFVNIIVQDNIIEKFNVNDDDPIWGASYKSLINEYVKTKGFYLLARVEIIDNDKCFYYDAESLFKSFRVNKNLEKLTYDNEALIEGFMLVSGTMLNPLSNSRIKKIQTYCIKKDDLIFKISRTFPVEYRNL